jgi:AbrB family looped-hinge helix DNA binding protein
MSEVIKLGRKGELTLPRRARAALGLREGDQLVLTVDEDAIVLKRKARRFAEYLDTLGRKAGGRGPT